MKKILILSAFVLGAILVGVSVDAAKKGDETKTFNAGGIQVYKIEDGNTKCYVAGGALKGGSVAISCVK